MIDLCHVSGRYCGRTASRDAGEMKGRVLLGLCVWTPGRSQAAPRGGRQTTVRLTGVDRHGWCGRRWAYLGCRPLCLRRSASSDVGQSTGNDGRTALVVEDFGDLHVTWLVTTHRLNSGREWAPRLGVRHTLIFSPRSVLVDFGPIKWTPVNHVKQVQSVCSYFTVSLLSTLLRKHGTISYRNIMRIETDFVNCSDK